MIQLLRFRLVLFLFLTNVITITNAQPYAIDKNDVRQVLSLNKGWRFYPGDIPFPVITGHGNSYANAKAGKAWGAAAPEFNDRDWRVLNLPHDWAVENGYDSTQNESQGYRKRGMGWYRRQFKLPVADKGKHLELQFDGISSNCTVWVNGTVVHRNYNGYSSFYIDITPLAYYGDRLNTISIRVDAVTQEGWWYEGAGIYRNTWLVKRDPVHIITDGVFANPVRKGDKDWVIPVEVNLENTGRANVEAAVEVLLVDKKGDILQHASTTLPLGVLQQQMAKINLQVKDPELWDIDHPVLYKVITSVSVTDSIRDVTTNRFGFRSIRFSPDSGFFLNDRAVKIKGTCNHQDHAGVGVAVPESLWEFRLQRLKEMGSNAYRCSHNPPAKEFLDACDRIGMLVMDENRNFNVSPDYMKQLDWLIRRDRNHPSIILWSVFNEEPMQGTENGYEMVRRMSAYVKTLDTTRPVTAAASFGLLAPVSVAQAVDVIGMNYQSSEYDKVHKAFPNTPITSSEDVSAYMVRGEYVTDKKLKLHDSYDRQFAEWGNSHRKGWELIDKRPFIAGCFVWTGFDYRGEPQPYKWPAAGASFGIMDQCGFPKAAFYLAQAQWLDKPVLQLIPHWNWPADSIGKKITVMALSNVDSVGLWLNGKFIGGKKNDVYTMLEWQVAYQPGKLEARGYKNGKEVLRNKVATTGPAVALQLVPYRNELYGDGRDAIPVIVRAIDKDGNEVPTCNLAVHFGISGDAAIIGLGNGNPNSHEPEKGLDRNLYNGLAQLILQSAENGTGMVTVTASATGLKEATLNISVRKTEAIPAVGVVEK